MSTFQTKYPAVFEKLKEILEALDEVSKVYIGPFRLSVNLPCVLITPTGSPARQLLHASDSESIENSVNFNLDVIIRETEPENWLTDIDEVLLAVREAVMADRTLGGTVTDVMVSLYSPGEFTFESKLYYGGRIGFAALLLTST